MSIFPVLPFDYVDIGMSYVFFRILHLILDRSGGAIPEAIGVISYFNYICFFPSLISGPIHLWQDHVKQCKNIPLNELAISRALSRIVTGYIKVYAVAILLSSWHKANAVQFVKSFASSYFDTSAFGSYATLIHSNMELHPYVLALWLAGTSCVFILYVYFDFSGYMDIAIGVGELFGYNLPENFNYPFKAKNFIEFWSRWHITLSEWFKLYVFNPLLKFLIHRAVSQSIIPYLGCFAYFLTFVLLGIWHGKTLMYVILGFFLGAGVSVNKLYQLQFSRMLGIKHYKKMTSNWIYAAVTRGLTFSYVSICLSCMWLGVNDFSNIFGSHAVLIIIASWLILAFISSIVIQFLIAVDVWYRSRLSFLHIWTNSFLFRNGCVAIKLFLYTLVVIQNNHPQSFVYQGF